MSFDPYAAPKTAPAAFRTQGSTEQTGSQPWEPQEVLKIAWEIFKPNWQTVIVGVLVFFIGGWFANLVVTRIFGAVLSSAPAVGALLGGLAGVVASALAQSFVAAGVYRTLLALVRGQAAGTASIFGSTDRWMAMFMGQLAIGMLTAGPFIVTSFLALAISPFLAVLNLLLLVPCMMLVFGLSLALMFLADTDMTPEAALRASWEATNGQKSKLFTLAFFSGLLMLLGALALGVGALVAIGVALLAQAIVFVRITGRGRVEAGGLTTGFAPGAPYSGDAGFTPSAYTPPSYGQPAAPAYTPPSYGQPAAPAYPPQPQYGQPAQPFAQPAAVSYEPAQPQYQGGAFAPQAPAPQPQYQQPAQPQYGAPQPQYQQPAPQAQPAVQRTPAAYAATQFGQAPPGGYGAPVIAPQPAAPAANKFCPECGSPNPGMASTCNRCGVAFGAVG